MSRVYNFSAGPAMLPEAVLKHVQSELLDWQGTSGMSVMEMSHRGRDFMSIAAKAEADLRDLMMIPMNYKVLFLQGGASTQFAMVPINLTGEKGCADYIETGSWSKKAIAEGERFCDVHIAASTADDHYHHVPNQDELRLNSEAAYVHYTPNETIGGLAFDYIPETKDVPLVADMSSVILSEPIDVTRFGVIYAGAQKNIGPAGLTLVIIRDDLIDDDMDKSIPAMLRYSTHDTAGSMYNTPPTLGWYIAGLVFENLQERGGLSAMAEINERKAALLYGAIDYSDFYDNPITIAHRSLMNVPFTLAKPDLDELFLEEAKKAGLENLKGHRSVGGMRASIYNAMPEEGVKRLLEFMEDFEKKHGK